MSAIISGLQHFVQAIFELIQGAVNSVIWVITSAFQLVGEAVSSVISVFGGIVGFILGNIVTIAVIAAAFYGYQMYQQRQGKSVGIKRA